MTHYFVCTHFGSILCGYNDESSELQHSIDLDLAQLQRFVSSCFAFSKCDHICSQFRGLHILAQRGSHTSVILVSRSKQPSSSTPKLFMAKVLLYWMETAYRNELQTIAAKEDKLCTELLDNYTVHDIQHRDNQDISEYTGSVLSKPPFTSFKHAICKLCETQTIPTDNLGHAIDGEFAVFIIDANKCIVEQATHGIICHEVMQFILGHEFESRRNSHCTAIQMQACNGSWRIVWSALRLWDAMQLFVVHRDAACQHEPVMRALLAHFEALIIGHDACTLRTRFDELATHKPTDTVLKPRPPTEPLASSTRSSSQRSSFSRKQKYERQRSEHEQVDLVVVPSLEMPSQSQND